MHMSELLTVREQYAEADLNGLMRATGKESSRFRVWETEIKLRKQMMRMLVRSEWVASLLSSRVAPQEIYDSLVPAFLAETGEFLFVKE